jgi:hypothetical protein
MFNRNWFRRLASLMMAGLMGVVHVVFPSPAPSGPPGHAESTSTEHSSGITEQKPARHERTPDERSNEHQQGRTPRRKSAEDGEPSDEGISKTGPSPYDLPFVEYPPDSIEGAAEWYIASVGFEPSATSGHEKLADQLSELIQSKNEGRIGKWEFVLGVRNAIQMNHELMHGKDHLSHVLFEIFEKMREMQKDEER